MNDHNDVEKFTIRVGRQYAVAQGLTFVSAFQDTLSGDLARLAVRRRLRNAFPTLPRHVVNELIEELLTP
jgi:hypothetical protein